MRLDQQSAEDLEFDKVKELLSAYCKSDKAKNNALKISPFKTEEALKTELAILKEVKAIHDNDDLHIPHSNSEDIDYALKLLDISNGILTLQELIKVYKLCLGTKQLIDFAKNNQINYPLIYNACAHIDSLKEVLKVIRNILTPNLEIKNDATKNLSKIRSSLSSNQKNLNKNFERALQKYKQLDLLGDTEETFWENRRLLTVVSAHKKKVKGKAYGVSTKGNFTYIEPIENIELNKIQERLIIDESNEILDILRLLTNDLRSERKNLEAFERLLVRFDLYNAKVLFANSYLGICPKISKKKKMYWLNAMHPLLYLKNKSLNELTVGQELSLERGKRFLVISGPNAGGKSITLKTIGLLQIMFQSALFVPVDEVSEFCFFDQILSDIGDNQSIDNQLSTYSYRLSRMKFFLNNITQDSLVLLDEFGSGSDPDLGGALAEVFFEQLYQTNCFAVINTHYNNIKILTSSLGEAVNACMLFDSKKLEPLYKLSIGQPGSSYTFEVAKLNGISPELIQSAKDKVSEYKVKLDELTTSLQQEKSKYNSYNKTQVKSNLEAQKLSKEFHEKLSVLQKKSEQQKRFFEQNSKFISTGKKLFEFIQKFKKHKTNKALNEAVLKYIAIEKSKTLEKQNPIVFQKELKAPTFPKPEKTKENKINHPIKANTKTQKLPPQDIKTGDKVKIQGYDKSGTVNKIKGSTIWVQLGNFNIKTQKDEVIKTS